MGVLLILHDSNKMEPCSYVRPDVVVDELTTRAYIERPPTAYTLCFIGCGEAVWEAQVWQALQNKCTVEDAVFMDRVITSSAISNIQSAYSSLPRPCRPPSVILSFDDLADYIEVQSRSLPDRRYIVLGIHAAMHFDTLKDLSSGTRFLNACFELHEQGRVHPEFLNFFAVDPFNTHVECCKSSPSMCVLATGWAQLSEKLVHWNATKWSGSPTN
jgi:hypothetical protein